MYVPILDVIPAKNRGSGLDEQACRLACISFTGSHERSRCELILNISTHSLGPERVCTSAIRCLNLEHDRCFYCRNPFRGEQNVQSSQT